MLFPAFSVIYSSREFFYSSYIVKISLFKIFSLNALGRKVLKQTKHVLLKNNNLIEKMASEQAVKSKICNGFSPFFFVFLLFFNKHKREAAAAGLNLACGRR